MKIIASILIIFSFLVSCQEKLPNQNKNKHLSDQSTQQDVTASVHELFKKNCALCHGAKGNLGINGAKDLGISTLSTDERINIITNGKGAMTAFKSQLTESEIKAVAMYTETLNSK